MDSLSATEKIRAIKSIQCDLLRMRAAVEQIGGPGKNFGDHKNAVLLSFHNINIHMYGLIDTLEEFYKPHNNN